jgi:hypothetical protein
MSVFQEKEDLSKDFPQLLIGWIDNNTGTTVKKVFTIAAFSNKYENLFNICKEKIKNEKQQEFTIIKFNIRIGLKLYRYLQDFFRNEITTLVEQTLIVV